MQWLESLKNALVAPFNPILAPIKAANAAVEELRGQARAWALQVVALHNMSVPVKFQHEKNELMLRAKSIKEAIEKAVGVMPELSTMNLSGLPVVVGGVALAGIVALVQKWRHDSAKLLNTIAHYNKMVSDGVPPEKAAQLVNSADAAAAANTFQAKMASAAPWLIGGFLVVMFRDRIFK